MPRSCRSLSQLWPQCFALICNRGFVLQELWEMVWGLCSIFNALSDYTLKNPGVKVLKHERKWCYWQLSVLALLGAGSGGQIPYFPGATGHQGFSLISQLGLGQQRWIHPMAFGQGTWANSSGHWHLTKPSEPWWLEHRDLSRTQMSSFPSLMALWDAWNGHWGTLIT